jgi:hypothetical protein
MDLIKHAETTAYKQIAQTLAALSTQDERIAEEFRAIDSGRVPSNKIVEFEGDVPIGMKMKLGDFAEAIWTRVWESVGRANWRKFEDARAFARGLGLKSGDEWSDYCKSDKKPADIPANPYGVYANDGWAGWGDWLGTGVVSTHLRQYRPFKKARAFVRGLKLKSEQEWRDYCNSGKKPADLPTSPSLVYAEAGWINWGDWLGTGRVYSTGWRPFKQARAFVHRLGFNSKENGASITILARSLMIFRLIRIVFMRMMAGPDGAIGLGPASVVAAQAGCLSRKPARSCAVSG